MAELSGHWTTTAGGTGHQQTSYTQAQLSTAYKVIAGCAGFEGVAPGYLNSLACTANGANTVAVATGGAMVDGKWYYNDANLDVNIPSAVGAGNTRIDRIVLRANWAGYEVAVTRIAGTNAASPTAPAITQTSGTTYDIMLCRVLVTTAGVVTVTDERVWALPGAQAALSVLGRASNSAGKVASIAAASDGYALRRSGTSLGFGQLSGLAIANDAINSQHYAAGSIDLEHMSANSVDSNQYVDGSIDGVHIANDAIDSQHYAAGSIDTEHVANDAIDDTKVGNRVPQFYRRQGGSATNWYLFGTTNYTPTTVRMQAGATRVTYTGAEVYKSVAVTFPQAFSQPPIVLATPHGVYHHDHIVTVTTTDISTSNVWLRVKVDDTGIQQVQIHWLAIGPE